MADLDLFDLDFSFDFDIEGVEAEEKLCQGCQMKLERKIGEGGKVESWAMFKRRKYCPTCSNNGRHTENWSADHSKAQKFKLDYCEACGFRERLHAHHCDGNSAHNVQENVQTLCVWCHNFLHVTAKRLGWPQPGRMPAFQVYK